MARMIWLLFFCTAFLARAEPAAAKPLVAVLAQNSGTEMTDFMVPYGVIASSGAADVIAVSTGAGPIDFMTGVEARGDMTIAEFDVAHSRGADFVIIPAFHDSENAATRDWLRKQASKGATLVSICDGVLVMAGTGLLDGHKATGHFHSLDERRRDFPKVEWKTNTRFVQDGKFISSAGVSASLPTALYIVELIAGRERAMEVARAQGVSGYSAAHDSDAFRLTTGDYWLAAKSLLFAWPRDVYALRTGAGVDEVGFAFAADMLSRTFRAKVAVVADEAEVRTRYGLRLLRRMAPEEVPSRAVTVRIGGATQMSDLAVGEGARAADDMADYLTRRYGAEMAAFVTTQLEYPAKIHRPAAKSALPALASNPPL